MGWTSLVSFLIAAAASGEPARAFLLRYDLALAKADFPSPAARLTINGRSGWFLFDTGAGVHMVTSWFAEAAGLQPDEGFARVVSGVDSTGQKMAFRGVRGLMGRLEDGQELTLAIAVVTDFPPEFQQHQVAGVVSPQLLAGPGQAAVLDMRVPETRVEPFGEAVRRLGARILPREGAEVCGSTKDAVPNLVFAIDVRGGDGSGRLVIDSGAGVTKLVATSPLLKSARLAPGGQTTGVTGKPQPYRVARGLGIAFAGHRATVHARVVEEAREDCGAGGLLGLDALRRCAVVLSEAELAMACDP